MTQAQSVLNYMREFGTITQLDAFNDLGIMRLASRISDLKKQGHGICRTMRWVNTRRGGADIAEYSLDEFKLEQEEAQ